MLDLWLDQESQIEKTAAQQFEELAEKIAVEGGEPGPGLEPVKPDGHKWESSNYSEEVRTPEAADQLLKRELTGRVVDEVPKTDVQQTPPRAVNTVNGRAEDRIPLVEKLKKAAACRLEKEGRAKWRAALEAGGGEAKRLLDAGAFVGSGRAMSMSRGRAPRAAGAIAKAQDQLSRMPEILRKNMRGMEPSPEIVRRHRGRLKRKLYLDAFKPNRERVSSISKTSSLKEAMVKAAERKELTPGQQAAAGVVGGGIGGLAGLAIGENSAHRAAIRRMKETGAPQKLRFMGTGKRLGIAAGMAGTMGLLNYARGKYRQSKQKTSSLKESMMKVAANGQVRTLEGWGTR